jgi:myo-inositol-1(or 4)-monophosphatase
MVTAESMQRYLDEAIAAAKAAGLLQKQRLWSDLTISYKGEVDLVTEVDQACEELIVGRLAQAFPEHGFLAEENVYEKREVPFRWIIDPLDGTTNFAHGFPWFCASIGLEYEGEIILGVIYHCMMDELFMAVKGEGAFLNGERIKVSERTPIRKALIATGFPYDCSPVGENNFGNFMKIQCAARGVRRAGAAALDRAYVAAGRLDGYWEAGLKPWDVAAGSLLVAEAGGVVTNHAGLPYSIYDHRILATNRVIHQEMLELLSPAEEG